MVKSTEGLEVYFQTRQQEIHYLLEGESYSIKQERNGRHLLKTEIDWAESDLRNSKRVGGSWLASHVVSSWFVGTSHVSSRQWYKMSDHENSEHRCSRTSRLTRFRIPLPDLPKSLPPSCIVRHICVSTDCIDPDWSRLPITKMNTQSKVSSGKYED